MEEDIKDISEMSEPPKQSSKKAAHIERMRKKYPDNNFDDEEELFGAINDDYDEYDSKLDEYENERNTISDMFDKDPRTAQFFLDAHSGKSPLSSYIRLFGPELRDILNDPDEDTASQIEEAEREYVERVTQEREAQETYRTNMEESLKTLETFKSKCGLDDEAMDNIIIAAIGIVRDGVVGKFSEETLDMICKAINHDKNVAEAEEDGRIAGRNEKITEKLRSAKKGDGINPMAGRGTAVSGTGGQSIFDLAAMAK